MTIEGLGPVDPVSRYAKANKAAKVDKKDAADSIDVSPKAKVMGEIYKASEEVKKAPDIRMDRVEEVKKKLEDPNYINDKVVEAVADDVLELFGLS